MNIQQIETLKKYHALTERTKTNHPMECFTWVMTRLRICTDILACEDLLTPRKTAMYEGIKANYEADLQTISEYMVILATVDMEAEYNQPRYIDLLLSKMDIESMLENFSAYVNPLNIHYRNAVNDLAIVREYNRQQANREQLMVAKMALSVNETENEAHDAGLRWMQ